MSVKYIFLTLFISVTSLTIAFAQQAKAPTTVDKKATTCTFEVSGVCGMCEERIEEAAVIPGVKFADWNRETHIITVVYKPKKVSEAEIQKAIAAVGHDTPTAKATEAVYDKLPGCCQYRDGVKAH